MLIKFIHKVEEGFLSILLVMMTLVVFAEVVARFVFNHGIMWAQELTLIINAWIVLIGASYCIREKAHIGVEFLVDKLDGAAARFVALLALTACLVYAGIYLYGAVHYVWEDYQIGIELDDLKIPAWFNVLTGNQREYVPTWVPASVLVIGFGLIALRFIEAFFQVLLHNNVHVLQHVSEAEESMDLAESILLDEDVEPPVRKKSQS
ncbi:MAG: C4-dicarboxylate ABC transporter permease [Gammaproteobacteria bacterium]|nr:MAG: C4-dicarboxylate ABC transporter permease [Gammaproteobacteria bacterium]